MVIGYPLEHSQSPALHAALYQHLGIDAVLLAVPHFSLNALIRAIKTLSVELIAVTLPYKEKVLPYIDQPSSEVKVLKAANTIIQRNGKLHGYNTDIDGIAFALRDIAIADKRVLVIGAGGAARALGYFLNKNNAKLFWMNRTSKHAFALAKQFGGQVICQSDLKALPIDIIVNTTPVGMYPHIQMSPLPDYIFREEQVVFDMVYNPLMTRFLKQAKKRKATIISGLNMFIGQGVRQLELLTGKRIHSQTLVNKLRKIIMENQRVRRA